MGPVSGTMGVLGSLYQISNASALQKSAAKMIDPNTSQYQQQLQQLISNPSSITSTPGYQFQYDQGLQALSRSSAAAGQGAGGTPGAGGGSGNFTTAAQQYGQNFASSQLQQQEALLQKLSQGNVGAVQAGAMANNSVGSSLGGLGIGASLLGW